MITYRTFFSDLIAPALQAQFALVIGFVLSLGVSAFYTLIQNPKYPQEHPEHLLVGLVISATCYFIGNALAHRQTNNHRLYIKDGVFVTLFAWIIACTTSAVVFVLAGFPEPSNVHAHSLLRSFTDGWYESMSGFTTSGTSILPSVEAFPRSILFWRSFTHWIGGMGIVFLAVTILKSVRVNRDMLINAESESPNITHYHDEQEAVKSGYDFIKVYMILTVALFILLLLSGAFAGIRPYDHWYENVFDAANHAVSTMGTGGFGIYDTSVGIPTTIAGESVKLGGIQNPTSEWIIAFFMMFAGMGFGLWSLFFFGKKRFSLQSFWASQEFRFYFGYTTILTAIIAYYLHTHGVHYSTADSIRYAFFNVTTIVSTTGLGNWDFATWPPQAIGVLFLCYLLGGMVGSTAGGLKALRYVVAIRCSWQYLKHYAAGNPVIKSLRIDGATYAVKEFILIIITMSLYFFIFLFGAIMLMIVSPEGILANGDLVTLDLGTALAASIANLGNIGPGNFFSNGWNVGPTGNYFAFSTGGKWLLIFLMYVGRVGVLTIFFVLMSRGAIRHLFASFARITYTLRSQPRTP